MKKLQKGFVVPLTIAVIAILAMGAVYVTKMTPPPYSKLSLVDKKLIIDLTADVTIKNNINSIKHLIAESYKNEKNPCERKDIKDSIDGLNSSQIICKSNSTSYVISATFISTPAASWCVDSSGFSGQGIATYKANKHSCSATNIAMPTMPKFTNPQ